MTLDAYRAHLRDEWAVVVSHEKAGVFDSIPAPPTDCALHKSQASKYRPNKKNPTGPREGKCCCSASSSLVVINGPFSPCLVTAVFPFSLSDLQQVRHPVPRRFFVFAVSPRTSVPSIPYRLQQTTTGVIKMASTLRKRFFPRGGQCWNLNFFHFYFSYPFSIFSLYWFTVPLGISFLFLLSPICFRFIRALEIGFVFCSLTDLTSPSRRKMSSRRTTQIVWHGSCRKENKNVSLQTLHDIPSFLFLSRRNT